MSDKKFNDYLFQQYVANKISRRRFMGTLAAAGASATVISGLTAQRAQAATPKTGGRLVVGVEAAQAQDSLDPTKYFSTSNIQMGYAVHDNLVNRDADLQPMPWLATSWESNDDASAWVFNLREGVTFHDGSDFGAEDVIYSMHRHYREGSEAPSKSFMSQIASIDKLGDYQVRFNLTAPNADFPMILSDTRVQVTKRDLEDFTGTPPGTGPFKVVEFTPGSNYRFARNENYWGDDGPYVDELEFVGIADNTARINALIAGDINVLLQLDQKATRLIDNSGAAYVINAPSGAFLNLAMMLDREPTNNPDFRLAVKYAIDREGIRDNILKGLGSVGNDHPIAPIDPYYNGDIPQREYDPEKVRFHIKKAGLENTPIDIYGSDVAGTGALASAQHLQQSAAAGGLNFNVINPPADSFWSAVWIQKPIITSGWDPRPVPDLIFSIAFSKESGWNETLWKDDAFEKLLIEARSVTDFAKRKEMYGEMQRMLHEDGGHATLGFRNFVDAARNEVQGISPHGSGPLGFYQMQRTAWLDE
ncbi:ABC transporter substrate-binding protein [uncultured Roseovarius sp.]|uniref:ABC transporter substrate-binding protein n=1 Tax=uncultured Roseovarius sp. TaxID=293344 RepID=UPI00261631C2|nr:ABC transporter substrate-binding protein [uncultured Roseovarius sp.]